MNNSNDSGRHSTSTRSLKSTQSNSGSIYEDSHKPRIEISRGIIHQTELYSKYDPNNATSTDSDDSPIKKHFKKFQFIPLQWFLNFIPILRWLPKYNWKADLPYDLVAGFTVAVFNIPQGMAYALLANLPPVVGIYMAFFPNIVYSLLGTSRHLAIGTFSIISLMSGKVILKEVEAFQFHLDNNSTDFDYDFDHDISASEFAIKVASALSLSVGIWQGAIGLFRLGSISVLLFPDVISGFTTGAAIHSITSQVKRLLGLRIPQKTGRFNVIKTYIEIFKNIGNSNITAIIISAITIFCLAFYNLVLKPRIAKRIPFPLPIELVTIIIATLAVRYGDFEEKYGLRIIGKIPTGLPAPTIPEFEYIKDAFIDGPLIAIVAYASSVSVAKMLAQKHGYSIDANQESFALGSGNIIGSFFNCSVSSASLSRSVLSESVGVRSQLSGLFCAGILLVVLLWIGPFFETVPKAVLAAMIIVALTSTLFQVRDLKRAWGESKINAIIWLCTFLATVVIDIEYGLGVGILLAIASLLWRSNRPFVHVLGTYEDTGLFMEVKNDSEDRVHEIPGSKIIKFIGNFNFATIDYYANRVKDIVPIVVSKSKGFNPAKDSHRVLTASLPNINQITLDKDIKWIILDFSSVSSIDPIASKGLSNLIKEYKKGHIELLLVGFSPNLLETLHICGLIKEMEPHRFFPSISDAIIYSEMIDGELDSNQNYKMVP